MRRIALFMGLALYACDGSGVPDGGAADAGGLDARVAEAAMDATLDASGDGGRDGGVDASPSIADGSGGERTLRVRILGDGEGRVRSEPGGLACELPCEGTFPRGARVTLTIEPAYRTTLEGWDEPGCDGASCTTTLDGDRTLAVHLDRHEPVRLSETDRDPHVRLRDDGLAANFYIDGGARSVQSVGPGDGVFYFEGHMLVPDVGLYGFGVATDRAALSMAFLGEDDESFGVASDGSILGGGEWLGYVPGRPDRYGMVIDYRGATPTVYVIAAGVVGSEVSYVAELEAITTPLHILVVGSKRDTDYEIAIEPGNDTTVSPFALDPDTALRAEGEDEVADALVLGFGDTYAGPPDEPPALTVPADRSVASGTSVTLTASASDAEDGDLDAAIEWELLSSPHYAGRVRGTGATFSFAPTAVGLHPVRARVRDSRGQVSEAVVRVRVPGPVAQRDPVRLVRDARSAPTAMIGPDGLSAHWNDFGKYGVRANQSLYGEFWYFEIERMVAPVNEGGGLVTGDGNIAPYSWDDVPASCSVNMLGAVWRDLIWEADFPAPVSSYRSFGFAVDYRGEHPIVYVIGADEVIAELVLEDVWVEIYPMIYGNPTTLSGPGEADEAINFGATPFDYDPVAALTAYGVDASALEVGWGHANTR